MHRQTDTASLRYTRNVDFFFEDKEVDVEFFILGELVQIINNGRSDDYFQIIVH